MKKILPLLALFAASSQAQLFKDQDSILQIRDSKLALKPVSTQAQAEAADNLVLTLQPDGGDVVAHVGKGSPLIVLLADEAGNYLVANQFGLTGWVQAAESEAEDEDTAIGALYGIAKDSFVIYYPPGQGELLYEEAAEAPEEGAPTLYTLLRSKSGKDGEAHEVRCDAGMSDDPSCSFFTVDDETRETREDNTLSGEIFHLPGNGYVYSSNRANDYFERRSKWALEGGKLSEVKQPYYYIGVLSRVTADSEDTQKTLKLTSQPDGGDVVAELKPGEEVWLLLETGQAQACEEEGCPRRQVLVEYGENEQIGWAQLDGDVRTMIEDFYFFGD